MAREKRISDKALAVLSTVDVTANIVTLTSGQLPRDLYEEVDLVLRGIGGKWNRKYSGHVFKEDSDVIREMIEGCIQTGLAVPLHPNGFFRTPQAVADILIDAARIGLGDRILEPSAGDGAIAGRIKERYPHNHLTLIEINPKFIGDLTMKFYGPGVEIYDGDFLRFPVASRSYERVIMNPPFIRLSEIEHVMRAWDMLMSKGVLVSVASHSITFRREKRAVEFREFIEEHGTIKPFPDGSFKESDTMVRTVMLTLEKP